MSAKLQMKIAVATMPALSGKSGENGISEIGQWASEQPWFKEIAMMWFASDYLQKRGLIDHDKASDKWHGILTGVPIPVVKETAVMTDDGKIISAESKTKPAPARYTFGQFRNAYPKATEPGKPLAEIHKSAIANGAEITQVRFYDLNRRFIEDGQVQENNTPGQRASYRLAPTPSTLEIE